MPLNEENIKSAKINESITKKRKKTLNQINSIKNGSKNVMKPVNHFT